MAEVQAELLEDGALLRVVIDRPKGNVLTGDVMVLLRGELERHAGQRQLKLVAIRGAGGHFSFGASVEEHRPAAAPAMLETFHGLIRTVAAYPVPVTALVEGRCLGGAFELALATHFVLATPDAVFGCPEIKLGVFPPVLAALGPLRLGGALAERLLLTGASLDAPAARGAGLVAELVEGDPWQALLAWFRGQLAPLSAQALRTATRASRDCNGVLAALAAPLTTLERRYVTEVLGSHDGVEGIEAFLGRRPPRWENA
ncbi:MAG: enoyl-CoA hydratase/isomerase family protein [Myxococcales bacterium]